MNKYSEAAASSFSEAVVISSIDVVMSAVALLLFGFMFLDTIGFLLLVEGAGLLLIGGALGFAGQPGLRRLGILAGVLGRKKQEASKDEHEAVRLIDIRAAFYMLTGIWLFLESLVLALLT